MRGLSGEGRSVRGRGFEAVRHAGGACCAIKCDLSHTMCVASITHRWSCRTGSSSCRRGRSSCRKLQASKQHWRQRHELPGSRVQACRRSLMPVCKVRDQAGGHERQQNYQWRVVTANTILLIVGNPNNAMSTAVLLQT
jgi:hypothetical protein